MYLTNSHRLSSCLFQDSELGPEQAAPDRTPDFSVIHKYHPLSLFFYHVDPITTGGGMFTSMHQCYCAVFLAQHHMTEAAHQLVNDPKYSQSINSTLHFMYNRIAERNAQTSLAFIFERDEILYSIMSEFLNSAAVNNSFKSFFDHYAPTFDSRRTRCH